MARISNRNRSISKKLTPRQMEIIKLLYKGMSYLDIANNLGITNGTVKQHTHSIYAKLNCSNRMEAVNIWKGGKV